MKVWTLRLVGLGADNHPEFTIERDRAPTGLIVYMRGSLPPRLLAVEGKGSAAAHEVVDGQDEIQRFRLSGWDPNPHHPTAYYTRDRQ